MVKKPCSLRGRKFFPVREDTSLKEQDFFTIWMVKKPCSFRGRKFFPVREVTPIGISCSFGGSKSFSVIVLSHIKGMKCRRLPFQSIPFQWLSIPCFILCSRSQVDLRRCCIRLAFMDCSANMLDRNCRCAFYE